MKKINLGILAHVDAGKTTLSEHILYNSGVIKNPGSVDKGNSFTDTMDIEKRRGISVKSSSTSFKWNDCQINLLDTPGHIDFSAEVERSLRILDAAILVISAVEGIQAHTETIWNALREMNIPTMIFINKLDRAGSDIYSLMKKLKKEFSSEIILLNTVNDEGESSASVNEIDFSENEDLLEKLAESDDTLLEKYLETLSLDDDEIYESMKVQVEANNLFPAFCGIAKNNIAVDSVLDFLSEYFPPANTDKSQSPSALVFKIDHDKKLGRIAGVRVFSGSLKARDTILNLSSGREEKITQIKKFSANKLIDTDSLEAGDIGAICGMPDVMIDDILGSSENIPEKYSINQALLSVNAVPLSDADYPKLAEALQILSSEDPHLNFTWFKEEKELQLQIMGAIQTEILSELIKERFNLEFSFSDPLIIYKETPKQAAYGIERYTMPKPCWAVVKFYVEPAERGSGVVYTSEVSTDNIHQKYQNEVDMTISKALKQGIKGWEVDDIKITLVDGEDHVVHSNPGDFKLATPIGIMKALENSDTDLLEPIIAYKIVAPEEYLGKITSEIINMRGEFEPAEIYNGKFELRGKYPLATSLEFSIKLSSISSGQAKLNAHFDSYAKCPEGEGKTRPFKGICPLDRSKYILKMRGAITE